MVVRTLERQPIKAAASVVGIAFAVAVLLVGLAFMDVMNTLIDQQFSESLRQDATLTFVEPRGGRVVHWFDRLRRWRRMALWTVALGVTAAWMRRIARRAGG